MSAIVLTRSADAANNVIAFAPRTTNGFVQPRQPLTSIAQ